jgi:hypothetical protein
MDRPSMLRQMIADYKTKIQTYQTMIAEWERELGTSNGAGATPVVAAPVESGKKAAGGTVSTMVREWQFYGKSQPEAARLLLELVSHPLTTTQIMEGMEKGGVKVGGKTDRDRKMNLYTILRRSDDFVRIARDTWALPSWPGVPTKDAADEEQEPGTSDQV